MKSPQFRRLNLNLLRVLDEVMLERSVARTASKLGLTPSAISHALSRLRIELGDELFVRVGDTMQPTPFAVDIGHRIHASLLGLERALDPSQFVAETSQRTFRISASIYATMLLLPQAITRIEAEAPRADIRLINFGSARNAVSRLVTGDLDLGIGIFDDLPEELEATSVASDDTVIALAASHLLAGAEMSGRMLADLRYIMVERDETVERVAALPHLAPVDRGVGDLVRTKLARMIEDEGGTLKVGTTVTDSVSAAVIAASSGMAALIPRRIASELSSRWDLVLRELPFAAPAMQFQMVCSRERPDLAAVHWIRDIFSRAAKTRFG